MTPRPALVITAGIFLASLLTGCTGNVSLGQETPVAPAPTTASLAAVAETPTPASSAVTSAPSVATADATVATATGDQLVPDRTTVPDGQFQRFSSPTGNISCILDLRLRVLPDPDPEYLWGGVSCHVAEATWTVPETAAGCDGKWFPHVLRLDVQGVAWAGMCDQPLAVAAHPELPYGEVIEGGGVVCRSERTGITCILDGRGFAVSRDAYTIIDA